jgi:hypothetical protein
MLKVPFKYNLILKQKVNMPLDILENAPDDVVERAINSDATF